MHSLPVTDPVLIFAIVMSIVLIAPLVAEKLKLPGIIGLITAGVIVGPHGFQILARDSTIELLGTIGLLYIMFQAGLEINLGEVKKNKFHSISFGLLTFAVPLFIGTLSGMYILNMNFTSSVLLASMFSSHTLISFPIVSKMGLSKKSSVSTTIGGTIITDTLAFLILAVVIASTHGNLGAIFWIKLLVFSIIYVGLTMAFLPKIVKWFFVRYSSESGIEEYVFVITVLFILAHFSHMIGLEPVIGAFLSGLVLNTMIPEKSTLMNRIQFIGGSFFIPFFLISVGMIINMSHFFKDIFTLKVSLTMIIVAIITKYLAAHFFGQWAKQSKNETNLMFAMSVHQAAATLAAVMVGFRVGLFNESILTGTIMMIVATCFLGSFATQKFAKKVALDDETNFDSTSSDKTDRILVPIKNTKNFNNLAEFAFLLHDKKKHDPIYSLNVVLEGKNLDKDILLGEGLLTKLVSFGNSSQREIVPLTKIDINVSKAILKTLKEYRISKVILNWNESEISPHKIFSRVIDQFLKNSNETTFITKLDHPLGITKNVYLIVPPLITKQKGFLETLSSIMHIVLEMNSKLIIICDESTSIPMSNFLNKKKTSLNYDFLTINSWKNIDSFLKTIVKNTDTIIQLIARQGQLAWRLSFDRLPKEIITHFKGNNYIAVYPPYNYDNDENYIYNMSSPEQMTLLNLVPKENFLINIKDSNPEKVISIISDNYFNGNKEVYFDLINAMNNSPIELTKEVLLVHTHRDDVNDFMVYITCNPDGFDLKTINSRPRIIIILLSPKSEPRKKHLKMLAEISKLTLNKEITGNLIASENYEEFEAKLSKSKGLSNLN